jgi:hypothetical protein
MATNPDYLEVHHHHRTAAIEDSRLIACATVVGS